MPVDLDFTGERFLPGVPGEIAYEHWHRYAFALRHVRGKRVLDAACGEGYGTSIHRQSFPWWPRLPWVRIRPLLEVSR
jgi:hypothetical protein